MAPSPFAMSREKANAFCATWTRDSFMVDQEQYGDDEALVGAIENAIWHEADRFTHMIGMVTTLVATQSQWLMDQEQDALELMKKLVEKRKITELATTERLCDMVYQCIEDNVPIRTQWQLAPDVIVVRQERLVFPPPIITKTVEMNKFYTASMNEEQIAMASEMLRQLQVGSSTILKEDLCEWLQQCNSGIGPVACNISSKDSFYNLSFPAAWQQQVQQVQREEREGEEGLGGVGGGQQSLAASTYSPTAVQGTAEETGVMALDRVMENLAAFGDKVKAERS